VRGALTPDTVWMLAVDADDAGRWIGDEGAGSAREVDGKRAWDDVGVMLTRRLELPMKRLERVILARSASANTYLIVHGDFGAPPERLPTRTVAGRSFYGLDPSLWLAPTGNSKTYALFWDRQALGAWAAQKREDDAVWYATVERAAARAPSASGLALVNIPPSASSGQVVPALVGPARVEDGGLVAEFSSDAQGVSRLMGLVQGLMMAGQKAAVDLRRQSERAVMHEAAAFLTLAHTLERVVELVDVRVEGNDDDAEQLLTIELPGVLADREALVVASLAIMLGREERRLSAEGASLEPLRVLNQSATRAARLIEEGGCALGHPVPAKVPSAGSCCASQGGASDASGTTCRAGLEGWAQPLWSALEVEVPASQRFVYSVDAEVFEGVGMDLELTARGDLDCDGVLSTFRIRVRARTDESGRCIASVGPLLSRTTQE